MKSIYPDYDVLKRKKSWDRHTREVVEARINQVPPIRFFSKEEFPLVKAIIDHLVPQGAKQPIPTVNFLDEDLYLNKPHGFRYDFAPSYQEVWHIFLETVANVSKEQFMSSFEKLSSQDKTAVIEMVQSGEKSPEQWRQIKPSILFREILSQIASTYYSHPYAWSEIGWGGPIYPASYTALRCGKVEKWEPEQSNQ